MTPAFRIAFAFVLLLTATSLSAQIVKADGKAALTNLGPVGPQGPPGPAGPKGPVGDKGPTGDKGVGGNGVSGYVMRVNSFSLPAQGGTSYATTCPPGKRVVGGGMETSRPFDAELVGSSPLDAANFVPSQSVGWLVYVRNKTPTPMIVKVYAICVDATP